MCLYVCEYEVGGRGGGVIVHAHTALPFKEGYFWNDRLLLVKTQNAHTVREDTYATAMGGSRGTLFFKKIIGDWGTYYVVGCHRINMGEVNLLCFYLQ